MIFARLRRIGLGTRIALTMLAAMVLIQALNITAFFLLPRPTEPIYSPEWLVERAAEAAALFALPRETREAAAEILSKTHGIKFASRLGSERAPPDRPQGPSANDDHSRSFQHLKTLIETNVAAEKHLTVSVDALRPPPPPPFGPMAITGAHPPPPQPSPFDAQSAASGSGYMIRGMFRITLSDATGDRIIILPEPPALKWLLSTQVITGILTIVLVATLSAWTAKRSLAPLEQLAAAARRMGRERIPSPVETQKLGDFAVVGDALNDMQQKIRAFIDDRTQMLGAISHDLRTALTRLRLGAEEVPDGPGKATLVATIEDMHQMITATLSFAGDDVHAEPSTQADVAAIVISCCDTLQDMGHAVTYEGANHALAICQPTALKRAIMNVAENAVKYGQEAHIHLAAEASRILITVRDKGPGIPEHLISEALRPFRRLETSRSRETGGVGLGLSIARDVLSAHGGALHISNHPEGGLRVQMELPYSSLAQGF